MKTTDRLKKIEKTVYGNGEEGLVHKVTSQQSNHNRLASSHEKLAKTMETIKRLMWFIAGVLAYSVGSSSKTLSDILKLL